MSPFQNGTEKGTCCVGRISEFKSFNGLLRDHSSSLPPPSTPHLWMRNTDTVGRAKTGPDLVPSDASTVFLSCTKPLLFPQFSYPSSLHNVFPIFQHEYIKYYKFIILWSSYLHDRQCKGLMDQFLRYINIHRNINTFSFSLWPTWLARFTNYVKWNNDSKEKCLINLVVSFILLCKVTWEFNLMLV